MKQIVNKEYKDLFIKKPRYFILMGGRGGGRSTVASQFAIAKLAAPEYFRCAIMRYVLGDIRNSIYREITDRAEENEILDGIDVNETSMSLSYGKNSINAVGFRKSSGDQKSKLKSLANYNTVIVEEADEIPEEDFMQLDDSLRTIKGDIVIILLLNPPPKGHWILERWFNLIEHPEVKDFYIPELKSEITNTIFIKTNYKDNEMNMSPASMDNYRNYRVTKPDYYWNTVEGLVPETVRGRIYKDWKIINELPHEAKLLVRGLDFGYSNDEAALVDIYSYNGGIILDEQLYQKGMLNGDIARRINALPESNTLVIGDSSEPKSIDEIKVYGVNILGAKKQKLDQEGSKKSYLNWSIGIVQGKRISVTKRSKNIIKEYEKYCWMEDADGNVLDVPIDKLNHLMDAIRYGIVSLEKPPEEDIVVTARRVVEEFNPHSTI